MINATNAKLLLQSAFDLGFLQRPEFTLLFITVAAYMFSFLVYGGYLSAFAGSIGNIPFAFSELTIVDLLAIFPMAIITIVTKFLTCHWFIAQYERRHAIYLLFEE